MEFLQAPTFTAFLALVLSFLVAKIVSFAVSNSTPDGASSVSEGVGKEVTLEKELSVRRGRGRGEKRVKFVDDVVIRKVDRYEGSQNLDAGEVIVEEKSADEKFGVRVVQFGGDGSCEDSGVRKSGEECSDEREMGGAVADAEVEGSGKTEMLFEKEAYGDDKDGVIGENVEGLVTDGVKSVSDEEKKREIDDMVINEREGNGGIEEIDAGDVVEEEKKWRDESDDDWEGVERSELEKCFAEAVNYVECGGKGKEDDRLVRLGSDVQMQLYGLHKVALEGPCRDPQPMALMLSSRTKWNAWQRLGSMSRELAMEHYIQLLSENIPEWMHEHSPDDDIQRKMEPNDEISVAENKRESEERTTDVGDSSTSYSSVDKVDAV